MPTRDAPQNNKQHAVPQNIMDVEFKLIGELTMRQFVYLLVFLGLAYFIFTRSFSIVFRLPLTLFSSLAGLAFAFIPIEDRGLDEWVVNFFNAVYSENQKVWKKRPRPPSPFVHQNLSIVKQELITLAPTTSRRKLEKFLEEQKDETKTDPFEKLEQSYIQKVQDAYREFGSQQTKAPVTTVEAPPKETKESIVSEKAPKEKPVPETKEIQKDKSKKDREDKKPKKVGVKKPQPKPQNIQLPKEVPLEIITPDRHSGRMFSNLLTDEGSLTLPIRGEKIIETNKDEPTKPADTKERAEKLKQFLDQVEVKELQRNNGKTQVKEPENIDKLKKEKDRLETKIKKLEQELDQIKNPKEKEKKQNYIKTLLSKKEETSVNIDKLKINAPTFDESDNIPKYLEPEKPNIVAGAVKNSNGKGVKDILIVIKNNEEKPVRAIKTNSLGEFSITNPLPNGQYTMEVDVNNLTGFNFDIIDFVAEEKIIPAMKIKGK